MSVPLLNIGNLKALPKKLKKMNRLKTLENLRLKTTAHYRLVGSLLMMLCYSYSFGQIFETENNMTWLGVGVSKKLNEKFSINYFQNHSFDLTNGMNLNFIQPSLNLNYKVSKPLTISIGTKPTFLLNNNKQLIFHRLTGRVKYHVRVSKRIRSNISLNGEHHFDQRSKFQQRYFLRLDVYYRNTDLPWKLRPFFNQKLYWYANGRPLQYRDSEGDKTELKSPNGLHAYRWRMGIKLYPTKKMTISAYYMQQKEFNTTLFGTRNINDLNPNTGKIRRPFFDFSAIGISTTIKL